MKINLKTNHLIVLGFLLLLLRLFLLKFVYLLILPGFCILLLITRFNFKKTLLFSLPLSIVLYIYPYFLITRSIMAISVWFYFLIPAILAIIVYRKGLISFSFNNKINVKRLVLTLIPLIVLSYIFWPYSVRGSVSLTAGSNVLLFIRDVAQSITTKGVVPVWNQAEYSGSHYFYTYPPLAHVSTALLNVIPTETINYTINLTILSVYIYMLFAVYMLLSSLGLRSDSSLLGAAIMIAVPIIAGEPTFSGNITMAFMFSLAPVAMYNFLNMFKKISLKEVVLNGVSFAAFMIVYHYIGYFLIVPALVMSVLYIIFSKERKLYFKNIFVFFVVFALLFGAWFVRYYLLREYMSIVGREGSWNVPLEDFSEFFEYITATGRETDDSYKQVITLTPLFFWLGLISVLLSFRFKKNKFLIAKEDILLLVLFSLVFFLVISELFPFHTLIPLRVNYYYVFKFWQVLVPLFAFGIARLYENTTNLVGNKLIPFIILLVMFVPMIQLSSENVAAWLAEEAIINNTFENLPSLISQLPGRVALFGGFGPALIPALHNWSGQNMMKGYGYQRHSARLVYENVLEPFTDAGMYHVKDDVSPVRLYNSFKITSTNTIVFFTCFETGINALNVIASYPDYNIVVEGECIVVLTLNTTSPLVELVNLTYIPDESIKKSLLDFNNAFVIVTTYNDLPIDEYAHTIANESSSLVITDSYVPLTYQWLSDDSLSIDALPGWVLYKGSYFPTLHAYQDNNELVVEPTYHGMTLIKSLSSSPITLKHLPHISETFGLMIYLVFLVLLFCVVKLTK